jgi:ribA/ribD-fused uncharacterized protein
MDRVVREFIDVASKDSKAEFECSVLAGLILTKDVADRLQETIKTISLGSFKETSLLRIAYPQNIRVEVETPQLIQKVVAQKSFKGVPVLVQRKTLYPISKNTFDYTDLYTKFRLREEEIVRRDWDASPEDQRVESIRLMNRRSYKSVDELFSIDFSMVKSRQSKKQTLSELLKTQHAYELEIEFIKRDTKLSAQEVLDSLLKLIRQLIQTYQQTEFILTPEHQQKYLQEFRASRIQFYSPVTLLRRHLSDGGIMKDYTVTIKADGERCGLFVTKDKKVIRVSFRKNTVTWTGLIATDEFVGDFIDGEYIQGLFLIFDVYRYKGKNVRDLPLMGDESRLTCAHQFVEDVKRFSLEAAFNPIRIQAKRFLGGDGVIMEKAIEELLSAEYEYETDGLVFTPKKSGLAPASQLSGYVWTSVYKWKPPHQNSIDFLLRMGEETYDPVLDTRVRRGSLYIGRRPTDSILYPCETLTGEFVHEKLPKELEDKKTDKYAPALFQPSNPKFPDAYKIMIPLDGKFPVDIEGQRVEDNTIIECSYDLEKQRWKVMRTRYDKTYKYRVLQEPEFGNERQVADNIWASIHIPITETMLKTFTSTPIDDDEVYYKEDLNRNARILQPCYTFHLSVKDILYKESGKTLLEFGVGKAGDFPRWKRNKVQKVVGIDPSESGLKEGCSRYLHDMEIHPGDHRPKMLLIKASMLDPLMDQDNEKIKLLNGSEKGSTDYLKEFEGLQKFDTSSSQFNIHYACGSEEVFRIFVQNVVLHTKKTFFGTCMDGQAVYSLLVGKASHIFTDGTNVGGEFTKKYDDKESWVDEFGMEINVSLESFDKPQKEYLVPFKRVQEIFEENGFKLRESTMFSEFPNMLTQEQQTYSYLNRTFIFDRSQPEPEPEVHIPNDEAIPVEKPKRKLKKKEPIEEAVLFHAAGEDKGPFRTFSNMAEYPIQIDDRKYPTVEHFFQAEKARSFNDKEILEKILETPSAKAVKALGKKVKNFVKEKWDVDRLDIMKRAVRAKFVQHPELQKQLIETGTKQIGDADARDLYWGIGTSENTEKSKNPEKWKGQNQLGKLLMLLRDEFKS